MTMRQQQSPPVPEYPVPAPDEDDAQWWDSLQRGELSMMRCNRCERRWARSMPGCPYCGSPDCGIVRSGNVGIVYSWTTAQRALDPAFADDVPYTVVMVDMEDGGRICGRLVGATEIEIGAAVEFQAISQAGWRLPGFLPVPERNLGRQL